MYYIYFLTSKDITRSMGKYRESVKINSRQTRCIFQFRAKCSLDSLSHRVQAKREIIFNKFLLEECRLSYPFLFARRARILIYPDFFHLFVLFFLLFELVIPSKPRLFVSHPLAKFRSPCELNSAILQNSTESGAQ